jgi:hypothetical protein
MTGKMKGAVHPDQQKDLNGTVNRSSLGKPKQSSSEPDAERNSEKADD